MKKQFLALLLSLFAVVPVPANPSGHQPVGWSKGADGRFQYLDFHEGNLPEPSAATAARPSFQAVSITQEVVVDFQCLPNPGNPSPGNVRLYCDSGTGNLTCLTSTGANCFGGGGGGGGGASSVGLAAPTGIVVTNSPVTTTGTLTWAMPTGWILGDLLVGNGANSVARLPAPTTPDNVPEVFISTPASGIGQIGAFALLGIAGRTVSGASDTILATDRANSVEYTSNSAVAIAVPDPASSSGFNQSPAFITINEGQGIDTFTPSGTAVITYCNGAICFANQPSVPLLPGQYATWSSPSTANWLVRISTTGSGTATPLFNDQLLSGGGVVWTGGLNFTISAACYQIAATTYCSPQTNVTLAAADPTNPRIDAFIVDSTGTASVLTGTPAGSPSSPSVDPTSQLLLTIATVAANAVVPTLNNILVYDENLTPPTEWTCTPSANFNCNSTNNPFHGSKDIEATTAVATNNVALVNNATVNLSTYATFSFNIRNKANWPNQKSLSICFKNGSTIIGTCVAFKNGVFGFNQANTTSYQQIVIPLSTFGLGSTVVDRVTFTVVGGQASIGFYLDFIQIQSAIGVGGGPNLQLQVNGQNTQSTANLKDNASVTFTKVDVGGVSTVQATAIGAPPSGSAGGALAGTYPNPTLANGTACTNQVVTAINQSTAAGTCSSVANAMLSNSATTPNGQTCTLGSTCNVNVGASAHSVAINQGNGAALTGVGPGSSTGKILQSVASGDPAYNDFPDVKIIPAANCPNAVAGSGWSYAASTYTAACRAGSNNLGGALQLAPSSGAAAQFRIEIPTDWDSATQPYIRIEYGSGSNTTGTVIWTVASACTKADGSVTDDPAFVAESAFGTQTMAAANRAWSQTGQFTAITSGNNCVGGGGMVIKVTLSGTASSAINVYQAVVTVNRLPVVQAN